MTASMQRDELTNPARSTTGRLLAAELSMSSGVDRAMGAAPPPSWPAPPYLLGCNVYPASMERIHRRRRIWRAIRQDVKMALRHLMFNVVAGSAFTPRPLRYTIYRIGGLDIRTMNVFAGTRITGRRLTVGAGTFINHGCFLDVTSGRISIGSNCHLAPEVMILTATHQLDADGVVSARPVQAATTIGDRVWIGARVTILPGVVVEHGCVIGAGAVVTGRCHAGGVYAGVPARRIRDTIPRVPAQRTTPDAQSAPVDGQ